MFQALNPLDATSLLAAFGTAGGFLVPFAETGVLGGRFLSGQPLPSTPLPLVAPVAALSLLPLLPGGVRARRRPRGAREPSGRHTG
ncbi:hypothetical protein ACL02U_31135 [Streptomyces sp. MS06]|uniref:hypothetical protein n=1 Tax=Streptomyces sp. MS06 TaxID=3385974 RepID=UPI0039A32944